jgi:subtilase family serine protease
MMSAHARRVGWILYAALLMLLAVLLLGAGSASAALTPSPPAVSTSGTQASADTLHARITGTPIPGTSLQSITSTAAPTAVPSKHGQIGTLKAALSFMTSNYPSLANFAPGPQDIFDYGIGNLWRKGIDGAGTTIALLEGWDDPNIASRVASFDAKLDLPNPPDISTVFPAGPLPATCPAGMVALGSYGSCNAWEGELTLDVMAAHMIAPYAKIDLVVTPADTVLTADAAQNVAPPEMMEALEDIARDHLANVISVSDGTGETTYPDGTPEILAQNPGELAAASAGIPFLGATGDCGVVQNLAEANAQCEDAGTTPSTATWDDSPWVTAVGGSVPNVSPANGAKLGPDPLWHFAPPNAQFSEGAGFSAVFARPAYQNGVASITHSNFRSVPDITMDAQDGTSEAAPSLAGVLALATQENHGANIGPINPVLYDKLGPAGARDGIADVVSGNNSAETPDGQVLVPGFTAAPGFDVASGWGTLYAPKFVPSLVSATRASHEEADARQSAQQQLTSLETRSASLAPQTVARGSTTALSASGFLPGYPVTLSIDGSQVATLTADSQGDVTDTIDPQSLGLARGRHDVTLHSLVIDETAHFTTR